MRVILVRHCQSALSDTAPPATWGLSAEGRRQAVALSASPRLRTASVLAAGPEPKMIETLGPTADELGAHIIVDESFRETDASWLADDDFLASVARLFASPDSSPAAHWECARNVGARLLAGIRRHGASCADGDLVVCSGGRALTSLLISLEVVTPDQAFGYWQRIGMPDIAILDVAVDGTAVVVRHFADPS